MERDPDVEGFLALLTARRSPRTVEAYRRDLDRARARSSASPSRTRPSSSSSCYTAQLRADGLSGATIARRTAAARSFFRHQQLLGARDDNPAAAVQLPRRARPLPKTLSPGEAERLIDAAAGTQPRSLRDQALVELLYGAGLRVSEAIGLDKAGRRPRRPARARDRQGRQGARRPDRPPRRRGPAPLPRRAAGPYLDRRHRPELFLNARGGAAHPRRRVPDPAQARREGRARPAPRPPPPAPPLVRHPPARGRRRPPLRPGDARPRRPRDDRALHPRNRSAASASCISRRTRTRDDRHGGHR